MIRRSFSHIDKESMRQLYTSLVRPHLEYDHAITYPRYENDKKLPEQVQGRAMKLIPELRECDYVDRLKAWNLPSLHYRSDRGHMIECYKLTHDMYNIPQILNLENKYFLGHSFKLKISLAARETTHHFFTIRDINKWNSLQEDVVLAPSLNCFKSRLDKHRKGYSFNLEPVPSCRCEKHSPY